MPRLVMLAIAVPLCCATLAPAQTDPATTSPAATMPVVVPADPSTPRGALKLLTGALDAGDAATARATLFTQDPGHQPWMDAMLRLSAATASLKTESVKAFGEEGAKAVIGEPATATAVAMAALDRSTEEIDGDAAIVRAEGNAEPPIELVRVDGRWRVPLAVFVGGASPEQLAETTTQMSTQAAVMEQFNKDLAGGKFKTAEEAIQVLQMRRVQARFGDQQRPSTAPSTAPSGS